MWGSFSTEAMAEWWAAFNGEGPPLTPTACLRNYMCRACGVSGTAPDDESLRCWCCESADHLDIGKIPGLTSPHTHRAESVPGGYGPLEEVSTLVG